MLILGEGSCPPLCFNYAFIFSLDNYSPTYSLNDKVLFAKHGHQWNVLFY